MNHEIKNKFTEDMASAIAEHVRDPRGWPLEARRVAESLGLLVTRLKLYAPTLAEVCFDIVNTADKWNRTEHEIRSAIDEISTRDRS